MTQEIDLSFCPTLRRQLIQYSSGWWWTSRPTQEKPPDHYSLWYNNLSSHCLLTFIKLIHPSNSFHTDPCCQNNGSPNIDLLKNVQYYESKDVQESPTKEKTNAEPISLLLLTRVHMCTVPTLFCWEPVRSQKWHSSLASVRKVVHYYVI